MKIVPADATIAELEKTAGEYEEKAKTEPDRIATRLKKRSSAVNGSLLSRVGNGSLNTKEPKPFLRLLM